MQNLSKSDLRFWVYTPIVPGSFLSMMLYSFSIASHNQSVNRELYDTYHTAAIIIGQHIGGNREGALATKYTLICTAFTVFGLSVGGAKITSGWDIWFYQLICE